MYKTLLFSLPTFLLCIFCEFVEILGLSPPWWWQAVAFNRIDDKGFARRFPVITSHILYGFQSNQVLLATSQVLQGSYQAKHISDNLMKLASGCITVQKYTVTLSSKLHPTIPSIVG